MVFIHFNLIWTVLFTCDVCGTKSQGLRKLIQKKNERLNTLNDWVLPEGTVITLTQTKTTLCFPKRVGYIVPRTVRHGPRGTTD